MSNQELVVIKHGSSAVANENGIGLNQAKINGHVEQHVQLREAGWRTVEVASGAVVAGTEYLTEMGQDLAGGQDTEGFVVNELAVYGTFRQMRHWEEAARPHKMIVAQVLATHDQIDDSRAELSAGALIARTVDDLTWDESLVVVNANDAAFVEEFGELLESENQEHVGEINPESDNDWLAAKLAMLLGAKALLLLGNMQGFEVDGRVMPRLYTAHIDDLVHHCAEPSLLGMGGMRSKLRAAEAAADAGLKVVIGNAFTDYRRLLAGEAGTRVVQ